MVGLDTKAVLVNGFRRKRGKGAGGQLALRQVARLAAWIELHFYVSA